MTKLPAVTEFHRAQVAHLQQAIFALENAKSRIMYAIGNSAIGVVYLQQVDTLIENVNNDITNIWDIYELALHEQLNTLQCTKNDGRGVSCVRGIVSEISRGDTDGAKAVTRTEWDKIRSYPDIAHWLKLNGFADKDWV